MSTSLIDRAAGTIFIMARDWSDTVLGTATPAELLDFLHHEVTGPISPRDLSDILVEGFDCGFVQHKGFETGLLEWRANGKRIQQHST